MNKPEIEFNPAPAPTELAIRDITIGEGPEAVAGGRVTVHYVGVDYESGEQFDASWDRGEPISFSLTQLIEAWKVGIPGMRVGGRRELICPPQTAYGTSGGHRLSGRTLVFVIDLLQAG